MDDTPGLSDEYRMSSPWPVFVALGLAVSEVGIVIPVIPLAVGGLLLFVGSIAGIVWEAGYVDRPWGLLGGLGVVLVALGALLVLGQVQPLTLDAVAGTVMGSLDATPNGIVIRGVSIVAAGAIAAATAVVAAVMATDEGIIPA